MKRIVCGVEGHGEVAALPNLVARVLGHLVATEWLVDVSPVRLPRSLYVDEGTGPHRGSPRADGLNKLAGLALARKANAVVLVVDADDDCAAKFGPHASAELSKRLPGRAVMACREFESWLLWSQPPAELRRLRLKPETLRDAKGGLARIVGEYSPTLHQLELTRKIDIASLRSLSDSFDKLVRDLALLVGKAAPPRRAQPGWAQHLS